MCIYYVYFLTMSHIIPIFSLYIFLKSCRINPDTYIHTYIHMYIRVYVWGHVYDRMITYICVDYQMISCEQYICMIHAAFRMQQYQM